MPTAVEQQPDLRYPTGRFEYTGAYSAEQRRALIDAIASTPAHLRNAVDGMTSEQLNTAYRPGGWTVAQVVHHLVDSHVNSYVRFRLALTEENPTIKPYNEAAWAELPDAKNLQIESSLCMLECMHARWVELLRSLTNLQWTRTFVHPEAGPMTLDKTLGIYAWHGRHHVAHINALKARGFDRK